MRLKKKNGDGKILPKAIFQYVRIFRFSTLFRAIEEEICGGVPWEGVFSEHHGNRVFHGPTTRCRRPPLPNFVDASFDNDLTSPDMQERSWVRLTLSRGS